MASFGVSFVPGGTPDPQRDQPGAPTGVAPVQRAIQLLSLRLPRVVGAQALAPGPLLQSPGAAALPSGPGGTEGAMAHPLLQALLRLAGVPAMGGLPGMGGATGSLPAMGSAPPPRIVPGVDQTPQLGPGIQTQPGLPAGAPTYDRTNPGMGNRFGGPPLDTSGTDLPPEFRPLPGAGRGRLNRY